MKEKAWHLWRVWLALLFLILVIVVGWFVWGYVKFPNAQPTITLAEWVGCLGSIASILAIVYVAIENYFTYSEVRKTKQIAEQTREVVNNALSTLRERQYQERLQNAITLVSGVDDLLTSRHWSLACVRLGDLAKELSLLATSFPEEDRRWSELAEGAREWDAEFHGVPTNRIHPYDTSAWKTYRHEVIVKAARELQPTNWTVGQ